VVLFISGDGGWNLGVVAMADRLRDLGALVIGIDIRSFERSLERSKSCAYPAGSLEQLSRAVQLRYKLPHYLTPILVGYSSGATLVYAAAAAAPPETFAGILSLGFCPDLELRVPLCQMRGLKATTKSKGLGYDLAPYAGLAIPWLVLHGDADQVCAPDVARAFTTATGSARLIPLPNVGHGFGVPRNWEPQFIEAYRAIVASRARQQETPVAAPAVSDLPLSEVPSTAPIQRDELAIILTGDGGWAELDKSVATGLATAGVSTIGWNSLRYYWTPRTADAAAADLARIISHYTEAWHKERVLLVGYSFGADVLPFLVNRLPMPARERVTRVTLLGLGDTAAFEFHVADWIGGSAGEEFPTAPEVGRVSVPVVCVQGAGEDDSACPALRAPHLRVVTVGTGHHFGGDYGRLVDVILGR
jgi:type IV secretory pathway VirJ component